ncbi:E3 ubiquitin-protein ligase TRIM58-like [Podarcis lilfordi]|uniref:E3 ubiquitin-protein ligase TRIM58-like n=1 Tax=Podarcis lilfordi TaxID=74358 RepID=A0AA35NXD7_9SAUR|nr:E3 ubiquitin-protein ligase TRIM58-like [Podarcis lilfordi]
MVATPTTAKSSGPRFRRASEELREASGAGMAFSVGDPVERLQEEVSCSICLEYLRDPVTIECGHNFCQACISNYCERGAGSVAQVALCPQCRAGFLLSSSRPNKQLANIVEGIEQLALRPSRGPGEVLCERHGKKLRLFCQDDGEPICLVCDKSREHRAHTVLPIEEAAHEYKIKLREAVDVLRKVLGEASKLEAQEAEKTAQWKEKVEERRALIVSGYERRRQAMAEEEQLLLRQLQDEAQETLKKLQVNWAFLLGQCTRLRDLISEMEQKCQQPAASLLKDVKVALTRSVPYNLLLLLFSRLVVSDSVTPWTRAHQALLSSTASLSLVKLMLVASRTLSHHLVLCRPLLLVPSIFPNIRVFSRESSLLIITITYIAAHLLRNKTCCVNWGLLPRI